MGFQKYRGTCGHSLPVAESKQPLISMFNKCVCLFVLSTASNFVYLNAIPTEMLTGPCAVQRAVSSTLEKAPGSFTPTIVNMKVSLKGVTLTDINRK